MVDLSPRLKFIVINLDEVLLLVIALVIIYWFLPGLVVQIAIIGAVGLGIIIAVKYKLLYSMLGDTSGRYYDIVGMRGEVVSEVTSTDGRVRIGPEIWHARSEDQGSIPVGTNVVVTKRDGLVIYVMPAEAVQSS
ncbi:MAG: NfeD family protein [Candidatus Thorarchaeota archaeon]